MPASGPDNAAIFHTARGIPDPDRRRAYVREACGGDDARVAHVEALLAAADTPDSLLDRPAGDTAATAAHLTTGRPGTVIGPYKLVEEIGAGGMGTVWMAHQTEPVRRVVALKLIKAGMDSRQVIARFEAERQALALMDHPNIAKVLDGGTTGTGRPYFVMDLVKGVPITRYCDEQHLTPRQRLELFIPVCQAVQHAHQKGIIHRDLKPSNVLVALYDGKPVPKVIDFGVAKAAGQPLTDKTLVTGSGAIVGTLEYMSPEQAEANQLDIDTRSDIYSLGVLLYELLAGSPPFTRKELEKAGMLEMLRVIREREPSKPSAKLSTADGLPDLAANRGTEPAKLTRLVKGELDWIVMKALEKDRNRRYETANSFAADVQRFLNGEVVEASPPSARYRFRKFARRNRHLLVTAGVVLFALMVAVGSLAFTVVSLNESKQEIESALGAKSQALIGLRLEKDKADLALDGEQDAAYARALSVAHLAYMNGELDQANEALGERPREQRNWEWYYLKRLCQQGQLLHRIIRPRNAKFTVTPDARFVADFLGDALRVYDTQLRKPVFVHREQKPTLPIGVCLSADGRRVAYVSTTAIRIWDVPTGKETHVLTQPGTQGIHQAVFNPTGRVLAWGSRGNIRFTDLETRQDVSQVRTIPVNASWAFTPDGGRIVLVMETGVVEVWDVAGGVRLHQHKEALGITHVAVSPDGRHYAVPTQHAVKVCELDTAKVVHLLSIRNLRETVNDKLFVAFSSDGQRLVHTSSERTLYVWDMTTGQQLRAFPSTQDVWHVGYVERTHRIVTVEANGVVRVREEESGPQGILLRGARFAAFSPGARQAAVLAPDGTLSIVDVATGATVREFPKQQASYACGLAFSPNGHWLATASGADPEIKVWDARTATLVKSLPCRSESTEVADMVAFSPDGKQLAVRLIDKQLKPKAARVWATDSWREAFTRPSPQLDPGSLLRFAYSPDSRWLALTCHADRVWLCSAATGQDERVMQEPGASFTVVAFNPATGRIAAGSTEGTISLWDAATGERMGMLRGSGAATGLVFTPDGRRLACLTLAPHRSPEIRVWDARSGRSLLVLSEQAAPTLAQFSPDGHRLMTGSSNEGVFHVWDGSPME